VKFIIIIDFFFFSFFHWRENLVFFNVEIEQKGTEKKDDRNVGKRAIFWGYYS
jgi:hypothetical protein